ncbi:hypothetical protein COBT_002771, partial [Conglomerata obtusa]
MIFYNMQQKKGIQTFIGTMMIYIIHVSNTSTISTELTGHMITEQVIGSNADQTHNEFIKPDTTKKATLSNCKTNKSPKYCVLLYNTSKYVAVQEKISYSVLEPFLKKYKKESETFTFINAGCKEITNGLFYRTHFKETYECYLQNLDKFTKKYNAGYPSNKPKVTDIERKSHFFRHFSSFEFYKYSNRVIDIETTEKINSKTSEKEFCFSIIDSSNSTPCLFAKHFDNISNIMDKICDESANTIILIFNESDSNFFDELEELINKTNGVFSSVYF